MSSPIEQAIRQICEEKGLEYSSVIGTIETALAAAYRKDFGDKFHNLEAQFDPETGGVRIFDLKNVVEDISMEELDLIKTREAEASAAREARRQAGEYVVEEVADPSLEGPSFNPKTDIMVSEAQILKFGTTIGDVLRTELPIPGEFGRMAAMTAKQVITQKLREAEREIIFNEFKGVEGTVITGTVQRREGRVVLVDIGRTTGIIKPEDQSPLDRYRSGDRLKFHVREVGLGPRGPQILLSRTTEYLLKHLFEAEIPEIAEGSVVIKSIAREAGGRSKIAVAAVEQNTDPVGACIGQRGTRIQTIIAEVAGEKIDIIEWSEDIADFVAQALAPAKVGQVVINEEEHLAVVSVAPDQLSLAIGRGGQNVRLASKLTNWRVNIAEDGTGTLPAVEAEAEAPEEAAAEVAAE